MAVSLRADAPLAEAQIGRRFLESVRPKTRLFVIKEVFPDLDRPSRVLPWLAMAHRFSDLPISAVSELLIVSDPTTDPQRHCAVSTFIIPIWLTEDKMDCIFYDC